MYATLNDDGTLYTEHFETWGEYVDAAENRPALFLQQSHRPEPGSRPWSGTNSFAQALQLAKDGWPEGAEMAKQFNGLSDALAASVERTRIVYDIEGGDLDIARFCDNEMECWRRFDNQTTHQRRIIRLVFNVSASGAVSPETMMAKGSIACALADVLELAGHGVEIVLADASRAANLRTEVYVMVKTADQPIDLARVAYAIGHPSVARRLMFAIMESFPKKIGREIGAGAGYGASAEVTDRGDVYIGHASGEEPFWYDATAARAWIIAKLKEQGVHLHET